MLAVITSPEATGGLWGAVVELATLVGVVLAVLAAAALVPLFVALLSRSPRRRIESSHRHVAQDEPPRVPVAPGR